jgi:hypothetical protein
MNVFNRIVLILVCLALISGAVSLIVLTWTIPNDSIDGLRDAVDWLEENNEDMEKAVLTAAAAAAGLFALVVLIIELTPRSSGDVKVTDLQVGDAVLSTAAISQRVEEAVRLVPHIADVRAAVKAKGKGVTLTLDLHVDPDANLAAVTDDACMAAREVLTNRVHVSLAAPPRARLHYRELRLGRIPARPSLLPPAPDEPPPVEDEPRPEPVAVAAVATPTPEEATEETDGERKRE